MNNYLDLNEFIPEKILVGKNNNEVILNKHIGEEYLDLSYLVSQYNEAQREHSLSLPRKIILNNELFEALGLLQAEMGKTQNGCLVFANSEFKLMNKVILWFSKNFEFSSDRWRWYIKLNMQEPLDEKYKKEVEEKVINHWLRQTKISYEMRHPKTVSYIKNIPHIKLKDNYYGSLIIEYKCNLFSQIIKNYVKLMFYSLINYGNESVKSFMKGIIAGEGCVENNKQYKRYRIYITAAKQEERNLFQKYLNFLNIPSKQYCDDLLIISQRENLIKLLNQRLMALSPKKYAKFFYMMQQYPKIKEETCYFKEKGKNVWNKISEEKIKKIIELYNSGSTRTLDIAKEVGISQIKVQRVLKENNLGKRIIKTNDEKRKEIAAFYKSHNLTQKEVAKIFKVHESVVVRAILKYKNKS